MFRELKLEVINSIKEAIKTLNWETPDGIPIEEPPRSDMGDIATSVAFGLAKTLKKSPVEINHKILEKLKKPPIFKDVACVGPYLNFYIDYKRFSQMVLEGIAEDYGQLPRKNERVVLEHTSANPNGPLHIGHIRNAIIGDSLARILRSAGSEVETQYYVNDMGRQIAMVVWGFLRLKFEIETTQTDLKTETSTTNKVSQENRNVYDLVDEILDDYPHLEELNEEYLKALKNVLVLQLFATENQRDHQIGKLYFQVNQELKAVPELKEKVDHLLRIYEGGEDPLLEFIFKEAVNSCLEGMDVTLKRLHVHHNTHVWESKFVRNGSVDKVIQKLKDSGHTHENEVIYLDLQEFGIEKELVLRRSDGTSLYSTRDLAYHLEKSAKGDAVIDILGSDHKLAIDQIRIALELLDGKSPEVIFYEFITLPEGSMSTRKGVFISVDQLMDEAVQRAEKEIEMRRKDLKSGESQEIAEKIGVGAIRYYIARLSPEKHIVFKWDEALSFERGCASIQYAHARACKLLEKADFELSDHLEFNAENLNQLHELELIKILSKFTTVIEESAKARRVHPVAQYAQDLAGAFNKFYKSVQVIGSEDESRRLLLVDKSRITIRNCLNLLGINAPTSM